MSHFSGYGAYMLFLALRTHFTKDKYDFFQMHGKLRATKESYLSRKDKYFFEKLAKLYDTKELRDFYIANFLEDYHYVTELLEHNAEYNYITHKARIQSLTYTFSQDIDKVLNKDCKRLFKPSKDQYPGIVMECLQKNITFETLIILNDFLVFSNNLDKYYSDDIIWPKLSLKIRKYKPFLKYDRIKMKNILKEKINEYTPR